MAAKNEQTTWLTWLEEHGHTELFGLNKDTATRKLFAQKSWQPNKHDRKAAWQLYVDVRTRIASQPLALRHGDEATALKSIFQHFELTRDAMRANPDCTHFATLAVFVLNVHIRPFTAKWHRRLTQDGFKQRDDCHEFRRELRPLQRRLRGYCLLLGQLAEKTGEQNPVDEREAAGFPPAAGDSTFDIGTPVQAGIIALSTDATPAAVSDMAKKELAEVDKRRRFYALPTIDENNNVVGLALSGGGIRSAIFALGITQTLARKGVLQQVDFMSTVSGGGYLGAFVSSVLNRSDNPKASLAPLNANLPFGAAGNAESEPVRYVRNHSKYLLEGGLKTIFLFIGMMFYGLLVNILLTLPLILVVVALLGFVHGTQLTGGVFALSPWSKILFWIVAVLALYLPIVQMFTRTNTGDASHQQRIRSRYERVVLGAFAILLVALLVDAVPLLYHYAHSMPKMQQLSLSMSLASLYALIGLVQNLASRRRLLRHLAPVLALVVGPLYVVAMTLLLLRVVVVEGGSGLCVLGACLDVLGLPGAGLALVLALAVAVYAGFIVNINLTSLHRFYRNRLAKTFLRQVRPNANASEAATRCKLSALNQPVQSGEAPVTPGPYQLINCAVNLPASHNPNLRGRNADFFLFSKHYCGSPTMGYQKTCAWEAEDRDLNVGTAMSISGAAVSPHSGTLSHSRYHFVMALLNLRLGYWLGKPYGRRIPKRIRDFCAPGWWYFLKELTGFMMHERSEYVFLSDGGHIENLGIYELLRRRCKFIIAVDGEADPQRQFDGVLKLVRMAAIDLNVTIAPHMSDLRTDDTGNSASHFTFMPIHYPDNNTGFLLYLKLSMTGNEGELLDGYRTKHPGFPHQSTADQFFDEEQFETYRLLGEHVAMDVFRPELVEPLGAGGKALPDKPSVQAWFQALANATLERESSTETHQGDIGA